MCLFQYETNNNQNTTHLDLPKIRDYGFHVWD